MAPDRNDRTSAQHGLRDPQERSAVSTGLSGQNRPKRNPAGHPALRQGDLEALDRISCPKPDRSEGRCLKSFSERIFASDPDRLSAEIRNRIALMNHFSAIERAEMVRLPGGRRRKGKSCLRNELGKNAWETVSGRLSRQPSPVLFQTDRALPHDRRALRNKQRPQTCRTSLIQPCRLFFCRLLPPPRYRDAGRCTAR